MSDPSGLLLLRGGQYCPDQMSPSDIQGHQGGEEFFVTWLWVESAKPCPADLFQSLTWKKQHLGYSQHPGFKSLVCPEQHHFLLGNFNTLGVPFQLLSYGLEGWARSLRNVLCLLFA